MSEQLFYLYGRMQVVEPIYSHGAEYIAPETCSTTCPPPPPICKNGGTASEKVRDYTRGCRERFERLRIHPTSIQYESDALKLDRGIKSKLA